MRYCPVVVDDFLPPLDASFVLNLNGRISPVIAAEYHLHHRISIGRHFVVVVVDNFDLIYCYGLRYVLDMIGLIGSTGARYC